MDDNTMSRNTVDAVERTFNVIQALKDLDGAGVTEIAECIELSKSGTHKHLTTLLREGYVTKENEKYQLGYQFVADSEYVKNHSILYEVGTPEVDKLADKCDDSVHLAVWGHDRAYCIYTAAGENTVATDVEVGQGISLHSSAAGKAILAHLDKELREQILDSELSAVTTETTLDPDSLREDLKMIRDRGVAFEDEESVPGVRGIGSPILSPDNALVGAIAVTGPVSLITTERFRSEIPEMVRQTRNFIEVNLSLKSRGPPSEGTHIPEGFY